MAVTILVRMEGKEGNGESRELSLTLDAPRVIIGRGEGCEVRLPDLSVSSRHASIRQRGGEYVIVDEGSLNGTYVNRRRVESAKLEDGDEVQIGKYKLTFLES